MVGNEHDTLTALGKLEDSLEKLEPKTFGEFMTRFRQRRGVSQTSFAAALHISRDTVKAIEADKNTPSYETLLAITDVYKANTETQNNLFEMIDACGKSANFDDIPELNGDWQP